MGKFFQVRQIFHDTAS